MSKVVYKALLALFVMFTGFSCNGSHSKTESQKNEDTKSLVLGQFSADSAYQYIKEQLAFGPRVPGTPGHDSCAVYIIDKMREFKADSIIVQKAVVEAFNGDKLPITNVFAQYNPLAANRILLVAHWDTRPWANMDGDKENRIKPVPGANDGASGVGVLLEIARNLTLKSPDCGVDFLFVDAEDYGSDSGFSNNDLSWCLGTQYWVKHMPYNSANMPQYGILLDMVGGTDARFPREYFSTRNVRNPTVRVWSEAAALGFSDIFVNKQGGSVVDDHVFLTEAGIPTTDVIENLNPRTGSFPPTWHTVDDTIEHISVKTLDAVGKTVLNVVYKEGHCL